MLLTVDRNGCWRMRWREVARLSTVSPISASCDLACIMQYVTYFLNVIFFHVERNKEWVKRGNTEVHLKGLGFRQHVIVSINRKVVYPWVSIGTLELSISTSPCASAKVNKLLGSISLACCFISLNPKYERGLMTFLSLMEAGILEI